MEGLGALGEVLEESGGGLERPGQALELLDCVLNASWECLGGVGRRFETNLVRLGWPLARFEGVL